MDKVFRARMFATKAHSDTNHFYGIHPYSHHLQMVVSVAKDFIHLIPEEDRDDVYIGCWLHDSIEDARLTYNDIKKEFGEPAAEYVYALTNEKGRTRKDRANADYYNGIVEYKHAIFIKLCDRIANIKFSKKENSGMYNMYKKESTEFFDHLYDGRFKELWDYMNELL